ncbi:MAG: wax ester/triacylglycerol synthase family O-acyltransferase [Solirubrobacterales bacterium]
MNERSERLSAADMSSLLAERGPIHVNVGATLVLKGAPPTLDELLEHVESRLALVPRFRQRVQAAPLQMANPAWVDDPRFDLRWHVRHTALPTPGSEAQLRDLAGRVLSEPLDLERPLWQLYLVENLDGGRHAYISKTHHALVDGVSAVDVGTIMLDPNPEGTEMPVPEERWDPDVPSPELLFVRAATERIRTPLRSARKAALSALTMPRETAGRVMRTAESFAGLAAGGPAAPRTFLNQEIGRDRRVAFVKTELGAVKGARAGTGATVNDVILSIATGGLRRLFERRGEPVPETLVALVPMSIRRSDEHLELGNRIATLMVRLPLAETDPAERLRRVHEETTRVKESDQARAASLVIEATGWTPPTINRVLADVLARPLVWNLAVSNVPGPQIPFYLLGRRMLEVYPVVPLSPQNHALSIGVVSYDGGVFFGVTGDRDLFGDVDEVAGDMKAALAEQLAG